MSPSPQLRPPVSGGIKPHDILYVLFKHKWKIVVLSLLGFVGAAALAYRYSLSPSYETEAKLLVRYVVERNGGDPDAPSTTSGGGASEMDVELETLKSYDVALKAAEEIGPEKVLPAETVKPTAGMAAAYLFDHFSVNAQRGSNVMTLSYRDSDPTRAVEVLTQIIESYFVRHLEIHRSTTAFDQVSAQVDQARSSLRSTEDEINQLKSKSGVLSIEGTNAEFESRRQMVKNSLMAANIALAEQKAKVEAMEKSSSAADSDPARPNQKAVKATPDPDAAEGPQRKAERRETAIALANFKDLEARLDLLRQERNRTLLRRSPSDSMIVSLERQISEVQAKKLDLSAKYPEFVRQGADAGQPGSPVRSLEDEKALLAALVERVEATGREAKDLEKEVEGLSSLSFKLEDLQRRRQMEEDKYRSFQLSLEKARIDETLDPTRIPNIGRMQKPSPPIKSIDGKTMKTIMGLAGSGLMLGLALAFVTEWVVDRRISRAGDIKSRLQLPLMLSIPYVRSKQGIAKLIGSSDPLDPPPVPGSRAILYENGAHLSADTDHFIAPYAAAIHDRVVFNFEINNITHKPKLVALTGLTEGAGTSTISAGLAKAFSEGGNRKVLLVDLNPPRDRAVNENVTESLRRALEVSRSEQFRATPQNLYFASASTRRYQGDTNALAPVGLREILPYLVASDFDYIVFDMPPVDPTSPTMAMAGFMDKVLLVLDADRTTPDNLKWAYSELEKGRADVSCIFNKARSHAPRWVEGAL